VALDRRDRNGIITEHGPRTWMRSGAAGTQTPAPGRDASTGSPDRHRATGIARPQRLHGCDAVDQRDEAEGCRLRQSLGR
jgi:hypothetical protein